jgi:hypothetical protein
LKSADGNVRAFYLRDFLPCHVERSAVTQREARRLSKISDHSQATDSAKMIGILRSDQNDKLSSGALRAFGPIDLERDRSRAAKRKPLDLDRETAHRRFWQMRTGRADCRARGMFAGDPCKRAPRPGAFSIARKPWIGFPSR